MLKAQKSAIDAKSKELDERIKRIYAPIANEMGASCNAVCEKGDVKFRITYKPQYRDLINKAGLSKLLAQHPDIYEDFVETKEMRIFKLEKITT